MPNSTPIACSLDQLELPERRAELAELGKALTAVEAEGVHARLRFASDHRESLERFVDAESSCCPFFAFLITSHGEHVDLHIGGPDDSEWAVRGLVAGFVAGWGGLI